MLNYYRVYLFVGLYNCSVNSSTAFQFNDSKKQNINLFSIDKYSYILNIWNTLYYVQLYKGHRKEYD